MFIIQNQKDIMTIETSTTSLGTYLSLGIIGSLAYATRFLIQWIQSEKKQESHITPIFWQVSLFGYFVMVIHFFLQQQYNFCIAQACNAVISWRNLNLMNPNPKKRYEMRHVISAFIGVVSLITVLFTIRDVLSINGTNWFRAPLQLKTHKEEISNIWHFIGTIGIACFASRFWVQWWIAEKNKKSKLTIPFWYLSIIGAIITLVYAIRLLDPIAMSNYSFGIIPYSRNLILIYKKKAQKRKEKKPNEKHKK